MSWNRRDLKVNPSLAVMAGGLGRGIERTGNHLINFGDKKVAAAKADALKKEVKAKEKAFKSANNAKNRTLNPVAVKQMASSYGIDENSPLYKKGSPSQFNADLSLIDLGKSATVKRKADYTVDNVRYDGETNKPIATTPRAKKTYKPESPKVIESYVGEDGYKYTRMSNDKTYKSANKVRQTQRSVRVPKPSFVDINVLTPAQAYFAQIHGLKTRDKNGIVVVDITKIPKTSSTKKDPKLGNEGGF